MPLIMDVRYNKIQRYLFSLSYLGATLPILFLLFVLVPIIEISLLIQVGGAIGGFNTIALVLITAAFGAYFVKREGLSTLQSAQHKLQQNQLPAKELIAGACLLVAGVLLVTPGFITDILGFLLVIPQSRNLLATVISKQQSVKFTQTNHYSSHHQNEGDVFEGEYTDRSKHGQFSDRLDKNTNNEKKL